MRYHLRAADSNPIRSRIFMLPRYTASAPLETVGSVLYFALSLGELVVATGGAAGFFAPATILPGPLSLIILIVIFVG
jgi:hypothetical protein